MPRRSCRIPTARLSQAVSAWTGSGACGTSGRMHCAYHGPLSLGATALGHGKPFPPPDRRCCAGWATLPHSAACRNHYRRVQTAGAPSGDSLSLRCVCVKGWEGAAELLSPIPIFDRPMEGDGGTEGQGSSRVRGAGAPDGKGASIDSIYAVRRVLQPRDRASMKATR